VNVLQGTATMTTLQRKLFVVLTVLFASRINFSDGRPGVLIFSSGPGAIPKLFEKQ
jgi:hypothetical protein